MNQISTGIISAPRKIYFLGQSLDTYFNEFNFPVTVFREPGCGNFLNQSKVTVVDHNVHYGVTRNWFHLAIFLLANTSSPYIMMCEDDIYWTQESGLKIIEKLDEEYVISAYTSLPNANPISEGWHPGKRSKYGWCGALALIFPRKILRFVTREMNLNTTHLDTNIGDVLFNAGIQIMVHHPTLVKHLGAEVSTLVNKKSFLHHFVRTSYDYYTPKPA